MSDVSRPNSGAAVTEAAVGIGGRILGWVVGGILGVVGAVTTIYDLVHHYHGVGPYLLAGSFFLLFLAAMDMWRSERRTRHQHETRIDALEGDMGNLREDVQHLTHERDEWQRMHAQVVDELRRQQTPHVSGGMGGVASTGPTGPTVPPGWPGYRQPPNPNQPPLPFDQDEDGTP